MITGINHITLSVCDLEKSFNFYTEILGCQASAALAVGIASVYVIGQEVARYHIK